MTLTDYGHEFRVRWKRDGASWTSRIVQTSSAARVLYVLVKTGDLHYRCDESHADCLAPCIEGPVIEERDVSSWRPAIDDEQDGPRVAVNWGPIVVDWVKP